MADKFVAGVLFNCKSLRQFSDAIVEVLPFRGISMSRFYLCQYKRVQFLTKLSFYRKTPAEIFGKSTALPHIDAEINILQIFRREITDRNYSPCILELVYHKVCNDVLSLTPSNSECRDMLTDPVVPSENSLDYIICRYAGLIRSNLAHNKCAFLVLDRCDITFESYLHKLINTPVSVKIFKTLLFMIIFTVDVINQVYPGFRHNDLHTANIMLKIDPKFEFRANDIKFYEFDVYGVKHYIPYFGMIPKIIDFGMSTLPEEGIISNATEDPSAMYTRSENDLLLLFYWIHDSVASIDDSRMSDVESILRALEPAGLYVQNQANSIRDISNQVPTYKDMVTNPIWSEYTAPVDKKQIIHKFSPVNRR